MIDYRKMTIATYNKSAKVFADYFRGIGSRIYDIETAFKLAGNPKRARVVEIGCGDGRDAKEIIKRAKFFVGFDISKELAKLAKDQVPEANFKVGDAVNFKYPKNLDVVFAFASLLHLDKKETKKVLKDVHAALRPGGIFYISLKYAPDYQSYLKEDTYGKRLFYLYNPETIKQLAGSGYTVAKIQQELRGHTRWFEIALRKTDQKLAK